MDYLLYWFADLVIKPNGIPWLVAIISLLLTSLSKSLWSWCLRQYSQWHARREQAAEREKWSQSLLSRDLSLSQALSWQAPQSIPLGRRGKMPTVACSSAAKGNRGKYGPWELSHRGPNTLLLAARNEWGLSRMQAVERLNVFPQELGRWERGEYLPTRKMLARLTPGYGKSAAELGYGELEQFYADQYTLTAHHNEQVAESNSSETRRPLSRKWHENQTGERPSAMSAKQTEEETE